MQNRFILTGVPRRLRFQAETTLRDIVEDEVCWVDRMAFLEDGTLAFELHLENMRDLAVANLDKYQVSLNTFSNDGNNRKIVFEVHAAPATPAQSEELLKKTPSDGKWHEESSPVETMTSDVAQPLHTLYLSSVEKGSCQISLQLRLTREGGTGASLWRGGIMLASHILYWLSGARKSSCGNSIILDESLKHHFLGTDVLELGAGVSALPSMVLGTFDGIRSVTASDSIDEVLQGMKENITINKLGNLVTVRSIDWAHYACSEVSKSASARGQRNEDEAIDVVTGQDVHCHLVSPTDLATTIRQYDTIMFADCIYTQRGATLLAECISSLLRPGGAIIGVIPGMRVGVDAFEQDMRARGFTSRDVSAGCGLVSVGGFGRGCASDGGDVQVSRASLQVAGGSASEYRCIIWTRMPEQDGHHPGSTSVPAVPPRRRSRRCHM